MCRSTAEAVALLDGGALKGDFYQQLASSLGSAVDRAVLSAMRLRLPGRPPLREGAHAIDRRALLAQASAFYRQPDVLSGVRFFPAPPSPQVKEVPVAGRHLAGGEVVDLAYQSQFEPIWEVPRAEYLSHVANRTAHARMLRHRERRPVLLYLHGYRTGAYFLEERTFAVNWLYRLGLDVVLFTLPFHGRRAEHTRLPFVSMNVARTNECIAQAMFDLRSLIGWLRRRGAPRVAVCGLSLGGYLSALLATLEPPDLAVSMLPVASFPEIMWLHSEGQPARERIERDGITLDMVRDAMEVHSPLARTPLISAQRMLVMAADGDRIAPPDHARRLAAHFGTVAVRLKGGHVLQLGRGRAFGTLARKLAELEMIDAV